MVENYANLSSTLVLFEEINGTWHCCNANANTVASHIVALEDNSKT